MTPLFRYQQLRITYKPQHYGRYAFYLRLGKYLHAVYNGRGRYPMHGRRPPFETEKIELVLPFLEEEFEQVKKKQNICRQSRNVNAANIFRNRKKEIKNQRRNQTYGRVN